MKKTDLSGFRKGLVIAEGKTKRIHSVEGGGIINIENLVIIENKNKITANDDPSLTKEFRTKAISCSKTTKAIFELLEDNGVPTHYIGPVYESETEFFAKKCRMIPLEVIAMRYAIKNVSSEGKRNPYLFRSDNDKHRFEDAEVRFFLKTTGGQLLDSEGHELIGGLDPAQGEEDPFIMNPEDPCWSLHHPKKPIIEPQNILGHVPAIKVYGISYPNAVEGTTRTIEAITRKAFLIIEKAFNDNGGYRLIDFKIEFGVTKEGELVIADVIDNDSWRLRDKNWQELSKQNFREGMDLSEIEKKYIFVSELVQKFNSSKTEANATV